MVGLVQHRDLDAAEPAGPAFHQVDEPAWGGHHEIGVTDPVDLPPDRHPAVDGRGAQPHPAAQRLEHPGDLPGQFPGRDQDQSARRLLLPRGGPGRQDGEQREPEGEGLARPGLGPAKNAAPGQRIRQHPGLDRERFPDATRRQRAGQAVIDTELAKRGRRRLRCRSCSG